MFASAPPPPATTRMSAVKDETAEVKLNAPVFLKA
jgi:hypothetical protein